MKLVDSMTDITSRYLEAAILDQFIAGRFAGKEYAFITFQGGSGEWHLGVAVRNEPGYSPIYGQTFPDRETAREWADGLNDHIGLYPEKACEIIASSMQRIA